MTTKIPVELSSTPGIVDSSNATAITIDSNENVGIGTTSPASPLHIYSADNQPVRIESSDAYAGLELKDSTSNASPPLISGVGDSLVFYQHNGTDYAERMRIHSSGSIGIGTNSPNAKLHISTADSTTFNAADSSWHTQVIKNDTGAASNASGLAFYTSANGYHVNAGTGIACVKNGTNSDYGADLVFITRPQSAVAAERMRITSSGNVGIGTTSPTDKLHVVGTSLLAGNTYINGGLYPNSDNNFDIGQSVLRWDDIYATNNVIQTSDRNEKNTIKDSDLGLDFVKQLSPKSYKFNNKTRTHYGLIAQDIETVLNDINKPSSDFAGFIKTDVSEEKDGSSYKYGLRYNEFIAPLIKAIQEQQAIIEDLQQQINEVKNGN